MFMRIYWVKRLRTSSQRLVDQHWLDWRSLWDGPPDLLSYTRAMIKAALNHHLDETEFHQDECFGLWIPNSCPGVPGDMLNPIKSWTDIDAYRRQAHLLVENFHQNFRQYVDTVSKEVANSGPILSG